MHHKYPKISIVTPSFNQGEYLEETILSILNQNYPNLEYIIIDGGSNDNSVDIIRKYEDNLKYWISESDSGQTNAINKGLKRITGEIWAYLCSDDTYNDKVLIKVAESFIKNDKIDVLYGNCNWIDEKGRFIRNKKPPFISYERLLKDNYLYQPSMFLSKSILEKHGYFNENLHYGMDYEYWLRISKDAVFEYIDDTLSNYRLHSTSKSVSQLKNMRKEMIRIKKPYGKELHAKFSYWYYVLFGIRYNQLKQYFFRNVYNKIVKK